MTTTDERRLLPGFGFAGYRSFAGEVVRLGPLGVFNVLAAQNNSGKSNVLRFAQFVLPGIRATNPEELSYLPPAGLDSPANGLDQTFRFSVALDRSDTEERLPGTQARRVLALPCLGREEDDLVWCDLEVRPGANALAPSPSLVNAAMIEYGPDWTHNYQSAVNEMGGGVLDPTDAMKRTIGRIANAFVSPPVATIAASRQINLQSTIETGDIITGLGVIAVLAELQNPPAETWKQSKAKFEAINHFVQTVMDDPSVRLHVPHTGDTVLIETDLGTFPLDNVGTGIHEVVMFAAAAVTRDGHLMCIEEPETHLHPILQRKLAKFLTEETTNQYLVATHSAHLLNFDNATIFHLTLTEGVTELTGVRQPHQFSAVCADLGYRPSDLLQANAVVWVEGPADRVYLQRWIEIVNPSLVEGVDYSIMIYGGSTLNHLSASDEALEEFISLRKLNRHSVVVIDSDKTSSRSKINKTKRRLLAEFESNEIEGHPWLTAGYTIENYLPSARLAAAVAAVHPGRVPSGDGTRWSNPLASDPKPYNKVAIARAAAATLDVADLDELDLKAQLKKLVEFIMNANGA